MISYRPASGLRIGDAERDSAIQLLTRHFADGRLTQLEHGERTSLALRAKTAGELDALFADLPRLDSAQPAPRRQGVGPLAAAVPSLVLLVGVLAATAFAAAQLAPVVVALVICLLLSRGVRGRRRACYLPPWYGRRW